VDNSPSARLAHTAHSPTTTAAALDLDTKRITSDISLSLKQRLGRVKGLTINTGQIGTTFGVNLR